MAKKAPAKKSAPKQGTTKAKPAPKTSKVTKPVAKKAPLKAKPAPKPAPAKADSKPKAPAPATKPVPKAPEVKKTPAPAVEKPTGMISLTVNAQGSGGNAASGNTHPANILVVVSHAGAPVADLQQSNFTVMEHFTVPGQQYPFSNNIVSFRNVGSGAYLIQVKPINNAPWSSGHHLAQIIVSSRNQQGITAVKIIVR